MARSIYAHAATSITYHQLTINAMEQKKYQVEVLATHRVEVWADDEDDAKEKGQSQVFEENINYERGDLLTGYKVTKL